MPVVHYVRRALFSYVCALYIHACAVCRCVSIYRLVERDRVDGYKVWRYRLIETEISEYAVSYDKRVKRHMVNAKDSIDVPFRN